MEPQLYLFLQELNEATKRKVEVVALGGNAIVTLGLRDTTYDIDLCVKKKYQKLVKSVCERLLKQHKVSSHVLVDGDFITFTIPDFWERAIPYDTEFPKIELRLLNINDILLCKIDRNLEQDRADVERIVSKFEINNADLKQRYQLYLDLYKGHPERKQEFAQNFDTFLKRYEAGK